MVLSDNLTDNVMIYGQLSTGYKAGGVNARPFFPSQLHSFEPETLDSYEVGIKSTFHRTLRLNAAVFYNDYKDIQLPLTSCFFAPPAEQVPCASQANIGSAHVNGVEVEAEWNPGRFSLDASFSNLNFNYYKTDPLGSVTTDMISPFTPENKASVGLQYEFGLGKHGSITPRLDVAYTDQVYAAAVNAPTNLIDAYTLGQRARYLAVGRRSMACRARGHEHHRQVLLLDAVRPLAKRGGLHQRPAGPPRGVGDHVHS